MNPSPSSISENRKKFDLPVFSFSSNPRVYWLFLTIYVIVLPIGHTTAMRNISFIAMIVCTLIGLRKGFLNFSTPLLKEWGLYAVVALFSLTYAIDVHYSLNEIKKEILYGFLIFCMTATWIRSTQNIQKLIWIVVAANAFLVSYSLYLGVTTRKTGLELIGSFNILSGTYSTYLITVVPFITALAWQKVKDKRPDIASLLAVLLFANLYAIYLTLNRQSFLAIGAACGIVSLLAIRQFFSWKNLLIASLLVGVLGGLFVLQLERRDSNSGAQISLEKRLMDDPRWTIWPFATDKILKKPLTGGGFGREAFDLAYPQMEKINGLFWHAHNMILNKGIQMGFPGMIAFVLLLVAVGNLFIRSLKKPHMTIYAMAAVAMLTSVFIKNMTDDFFVRDNALLFWLLAGAVIGASQEKYVVEKANL